MSALFDQLTAAIKPHNDKLIAEGRAERLRVRAEEMLAALETAADHIKDMDGGDPSTETGWKSDETLAVWLKAVNAIAKAKTLPELAR